VHEFLGLGAARHVTAFFLQIFSDVLQQRVVRAAGEAERRACNVADLMGCDVADDARQLFLEVRLRRLEQLTERLCDFGVALDVNRSGLPESVASGVPS
jgi:hypothetical protein